MNKIKFIISSLLSDLIEYFLVFVLLHWVFKVSLINTFIIMGITLLIMIIIVMISFILIPKVENDIEIPDFAERVNEIIDDVNNKYKTKIKCMYFDFHLPNPACNMGKYLFINTSSTVDKDFIDGLTAHEIGHNLSGISRLTFLASVKPICFIGKILFYNLYVLCENKGKNWLSIIFKIGFVITNITNILLVFPLIKEDEITANRFAAKLGYGESLRTYYFQCLDSQFNDFQHPSAKKMIEMLNKDMHLKGIEKDLYYAGEKLYYAEPKTKSLYVRSGIKYLGTIKSDTLVKLEGLDVKFINSYRNNLPNLRKINLPNCTLNQIKRLVKSIDNCQIVSLKQDEIN